MDSFNPLIDWLIDCLLDCLIDWLLDWLLDWLTLQIWPIEIIRSIVRTESLDLFSTTLSYLFKLKIVFCEILYMLTPSRKCVHILEWLSLVKTGFIEKEGVVQEVPCVPPIYYLICCATKAQQRFTDALRQSHACMYVASCGVLTRNAERVPGSVPGNEHI